MHGDALSSTQLVTDENGDQVARFVYGAWGEELHATDNVPGGLDVRFIGGLGVRNDAASGLIYMRHRWYDAQLGRFISRDPIGLEGDTNLYRYGNNNPLMYVDYTGLQTLYNEAGWSAVYSANRNLATEFVLFQMLERSGMSKDWGSVTSRILGENKVVWGQNSQRDSALGWSGSDGVIYLHSKLDAFDAARVLFHEIVHRAIDKAEAGDSDCRKLVPRGTGIVERERKNFEVINEAEVQEAKWRNELYAYNMSELLFVRGAPQGRQSSTASPRVLMSKVREVFGSPYIDFSNSAKVNLMKQKFFEAGYNR